MTGRTVPEWIGANPDAKVPPRVRLRIFEREGGRCWISGRKIMVGDKWDLDHKLALCNGGTHSEDNLFPALKDKHKAKTRADVRQKSDTARKRQKHLGIKTDSGRKLQSRGFDKTRRKKMNGTVEVRS
jgi:5-methylcytosine-specific restriction enzyme A